MPGMFERSCFSHLWGASPLADREVSTCVWGGGQGWNVGKMMVDKASFSSVLKGFFQNLHRNIYVCVVVLVRFLSVHCFSLSCHLSYRLEHQCQCQTIISTEISQVGTIFFNDRRSDVTFCFFLSATCRYHICACQIRGGIPLWRTGCVKPRFYPGSGQKNSY